MNEYYPLIENLIRIKKNYSLELEDLVTINKACNILLKEGDKNAQNKD